MVSTQLEDLTEVSDNDNVFSHILAGNHSQTRPGPYINCNHSQTPPGHPGLILTVACLAGLLLLLYPFIIVQTDEVW